MIDHAVHIATHSCVLLLKVNVRSTNLISNLCIAHPVVATWLSWTTDNKKQRLTFNESQVT